MTQIIFRIKDILKHGESDHEALVLASRIRR
jgi:hypothetical protein